MILISCAVAQASLFNASITLCILFISRCKDIATVARSSAIASGTGALIRADSICDFAPCNRSRVLRICSMSILKPFCCQSVAPLRPIHSNNIKFISCCQATKLNNRINPQHLLNRSRLHANTDAKFKGLNLQHLQHLQHLQQENTKTFPLVVFSLGKKLGFYRCK